MNIDRSMNGTDLCGSQLWLERPADLKRRVRVTRATRIGVDYSGEWAQRLWRFYDRDSLFVSTASAAARTRHLNALTRNANTPDSHTESGRPSRR
jgi:3-methyladenine DNA glycosylase Mpg